MQTDGESPNEALADLGSEIAASDPETAAPVQRIGDGNTDFDRAMSGNILFPAGGVIEFGLRRLRQLIRRG